MPTFSVPPSLCTRASLSLGSKSVSSAVTASCLLLWFAAGVRGSADTRTPELRGCPRAGATLGSSLPCQHGREPAGGMIISSLLPRLSRFYHDTDDTCSLLPHPWVSGAALPRLARASRRGGSPVPRDHAGGDRGYGMSHRAAAAPSPAPRRSSACTRGSASPSLETRGIGKRGEE